MVLHRTVADLVCYHMSAPNGLQTQLTRPCIRPDAASAKAANSDA